MRAGLPVQPIWGTLPCLPSRRSDLVKTLSNSSITDRSTPDQDSVAGWFDGTYREKGFAYLRPPAAYPIFLQLLDAQPGERLLDVACGPGLLLKAAECHGVVPSGIDISGVAVAMARQLVPGADVRESNAEQLPFADATFDLLTCVGSLERMFDRRKVLEEMRRVTRPGARLCIMLRNAGAPGWRIWRRLLSRQNHAGHQDARSMDQWRQLIESAGFEVDNIVMDQWSRQKLRHWLRLGRHPQPGVPEIVARPLLPMNWVYEHIFLLRR